MASATAVRSSVIGPNSRASAAAAATRTAAATAWPRLASRAAVSTEGSSRTAGSPEAIPPSGISRSGMSGGGWPGTGWPRTGLPGTGTSLPQLVDAVVAAATHEHGPVRGELRRPEGQADLVRGRVVPAPLDDPLDVVGPRVAQRRLPLVVAAFIDELVRGQLEGDALVAERLHQDQAAAVVRLQVGDDRILLEHRSEE